MNGKVQNINNDFLSHLAKIFVGCFLYDPFLLIMNGIAKSLYKVHDDSSTKKLVEYKQIFYMITKRNSVRYGSKWKRSSRNKIIKTDKYQNGKKYVQQNTNMLTTLEFYYGIKSFQILFATKLVPF